MTFTEVVLATRIFMAIHGCIPISKIVYYAGKNLFFICAA
jgi:hypothetical protein